MDANSSATSKEPDASPWGAFGRLPFAAIWIASTIALIGIAMYDTASGWLMTTLDADPLAVSSVQVATSLPMFLFTLPAGALADIIDARRFLIIVSTAIAALMAIFGTLVSLDLATPFSLLLTTFLLSAAWALNAPAWLSIMPLLVPRSELDGAIAAGSIGYNISRVVGPALGGLAIVSLGMAAPFWAFAASNVAAIAALVWWRSPRRSAESLPAERLTSAVRTGFRHAANNQHLRATMVRTVAIYPFASAYLALLPLIARRQIGQGPEFYGVLLCAISAGAIVGSFAIKRLKDRLGPDRVVALGSIGTAIALVLFGLAREPLIALCACFLAGASWIVVLANSLRIGSGRVARLGARARAFDFPDRHLRRRDGRQRGMGASRGRGGPSHGAIHRGGRRDPGHSADMELEASDRRWARPHPFDALAGPQFHAQGRERSGASHGERRISRRLEEPLRVSRRSRRTGA